MKVYRTCVMIVRLIQRYYEDFIEEMGEIRSILFMKLEALNLLEAVTFD